MAFPPFFQRPKGVLLRISILRMLTDEPMHGYQLMEELEERGFVLPRRLESGTVYTILRRMETNGLLKSKWEKMESSRDRRIYKVTEEGSQALKMGLETMVKRKALMEDLTAFYRKQFQEKKES